MGGSSDDELDYLLAAGLVATGAETTAGATRVSVAGFLGATELGVDSSSTLGCP